MGTEVESQNSIHRLSQIISDTFLFLEGEDDGTANGNDISTDLERELDGTACGAAVQNLTLPANGNDVAVVNGNTTGSCDVTSGNPPGVSERRRLFEASSCVKRRSTESEDSLKVVTNQTFENKRDTLEEIGKKTSERVAFWEQEVRAEPSRWSVSQMSGGLDLSCDKNSQRNSLVTMEASSLGLLRPPSTSGSVSSSGSFGALSQGSDSQTRSSGDRDSWDFSTENCDRIINTHSEEKASSRSDLKLVDLETKHQRKSEPTLEISTNSDLSGHSHVTRARSKLDLGEEKLMAHARAIVEEVLSYESLKQAVENREITRLECMQPRPETQGQGQMGVRNVGHDEADIEVIEGKKSDPEVVDIEENSSITLDMDFEQDPQSKEDDLNKTFDSRTLDSASSDDKITPQIEEKTEPSSNSINCTESHGDGDHGSSTGEALSDSLVSDNTQNTKGLNNNSENEDSMDGMTPKNIEVSRMISDILKDKQETETEPEMSPAEQTASPVVLRRKKSDVKSPSGSTNDGNGSPSPTASPGTLKRRALRSPLARLRPVWDYTDIPSDGDSPRQSEDSDDDDDAGIYADSYRNSQWFYLGGATSTETLDIDITESHASSSSSIFEATPDPAEVNPMTLRSLSVDPSMLSPSGKDDVNVSVDSGLGQRDTSPRLYKQNDLPMTIPRRSGHVRSDSISTTASELEFRKRYQAKTKRVVQRKSSTQTYQRMSERFYDDERCITVEKRPGDTTFGFHIKGSNPVAISTVEADSAAEGAGVKISEVVIAINDVNVLEATHQEAIKLISQDGDRVKLTVASDSKLVSDRPLCSGFLVKQGGTGILKNWRRRWFILKNDHCLYYYKTEGDRDPLGAILLTNYTVTKAPEMNRKHTFKAHKYGQRTYYFQAESEDDMNVWASTMTTAAMATAKTDTWLDISSHNVGLPALSIKSPDCHGYLTKMGNRRKNWKRRYCVLKDACLYYYLEGTSMTAQGVAHLHGYNVESTLPFNKKFGFTVNPPDASMRTFYFYADNETDMKRWLTALQKSIGRWVREDDM